MSSFATFYVLPEAKRLAFEEARRTEKTVTWQRGFLGFGRREVVTGDRYLWEFLDEEAEAKHEFEESGFVLIDYFLTFVTLPEPLQTQLGAATSPDAHYYRFEPSLAAALAGYLETHPPDPSELRTFASEQGHEAEDSVPRLTACHDTLIGWWRRVSESRFGVLHLTF